MGAPSPCPAVLASQGGKNPAAKPEGKNLGLFAAAWRSVGRGAEMHPRRDGEPPASARPPQLCHSLNTMRYFKIISALMNCWVVRDCS